MRTTITMVMANILARLARRHRIFLAVIGLLLALFQIFVSAAVVTVDLEGILGEVRRSLPTVIQNLVGEEMALTMTARGLLVFAWNHPITHALLASVMILLGSRAIAGEIETGTLELVLAQPVSRAGYLFAQLCFAAMALLALVSLMMAGMFLGRTFFELGNLVQWQTFLPVAVNLVCLELAMLGFTLLVSAWSHENGRVVTVSLLVVLVSYLVQAIGRFLPAVAFFLPWSVFEYYSPQRTVLLGESPWGNAVILLSVGIACGGLGWWKFMKRDIP